MTAINNTAEFGGLAFVISDQKEIYEKFMNVNYTNNTAKHL